MPPRVLLAACEALPRGDGDEDILLPALSRLGFDADWIVWDDPGNAAAEADLVMLRATWDYSARRAEFLRWCESVPRLRNFANVVRWNTDKAYLLELAGAGLSVVPTQLVAPGGQPEWPEDDFVVKPSVGAGSRGAKRFSAGAMADAREHLAALHDGGYSVLVQPYQSDVDTHGETAMVFIGGRYSHAFTKGAMLGGSAVDASGLFVSERLEVADPGAALRSFAEDAMDAAASVLGMPRTDLLYARVDVVRGADGAPTLLEFELAEPSLGLKLAGERAADRLAAAVGAVV
ncbi:MAG: hypothetical protein GEU86_00995 [Actinophytocola sp.]|nr:hypothetical protein [Actinophytocola sp.]